MLARVEGAPAGVKGVSLIIVPKFLVNADGTLGERNDLRCVSIEHKLGIHASPTCMLAFGEARDAIGFLIGSVNRGLEYMFIMMNVARLSLGVEGYAVAERAFQRAAEWAKTCTGKAARSAGKRADRLSPRCQTHAVHDEVVHSGNASARPVCGVAARYRRA